MGPVDVQLPDEVVWMSPKCSGVKNQMIKLRHLGGREAASMISLGWSTALHRHPLRKSPQGSFVSIKRHQNTELNL